MKRRMLLFSQITSDFKENVINQPDNDINDDNTCCAGEQKYFLKRRMA
jgi:hypothetical protein